MEWIDLYYNKLSLEGTKQYYLRKTKAKEYFIKTIIKYSPNKKVLEAGCGSGIVSIYLSNFGFDVAAIDCDQHMLALSKRICNDLCLINPNYINADFMECNIEKCDVIYNYGTMEHFTDQLIIRAIKKFLSFAKVFIFGVPTDYFSQEQALHGDERFLSVSKWKHLISLADGIILEEISDATDNSLSSSFMIFVITKISKEST